MKIKIWYKYFDWFPVQRCQWCGKFYWGGWPMFEDGKCVWKATWKEYCSKPCADADMDWIDKIMSW